MPELDFQIDFYQALHREWSKLNETSSQKDIFGLALHFITEKLNYERCILFVQDDQSGLFKVHSQAGYKTPEQLVRIKIINLLLSGEIIEQLRLTGESITHSQATTNPLVDKLSDSLFLKEARFDLFGGDINVPFGLIVIGNASNIPRTPVDNRLFQVLSQTVISNLANAINNRNFYQAWNNERQLLQEHIAIRTHELQAQKETFEAIYLTSKDGIAILDVHTSAFLDVNPAYLEMTGFNREELLRTSCVALSKEDDKERSIAVMQEVAQKGFVKDFVKTCIVKNGREVNVIMSLVLMSDGQRMLVTNKDLTSRINLEKALLEAKEKAESAARMKSAFLATMSHEIRTPMNGILGMSHLVLQSGLNAKQKSYLHKIDRSANSLLRIIDDILDYSKIEAGKLTLDESEFDLYEMVDDVFSHVARPKENKGVELIVRYSTSLDNKIVGDSFRLSQVLTNLISNALKFTEQGEIELSVQAVSNKTVRFEVRDTGIGIAAEQQAKLFESFTQADNTTSRKHGGTGLGLAISKQLVELMGGSIWIKSTLNKGSHFIFEIPLTFQINQTTPAPDLKQTDAWLILGANQNQNSALTLIAERLGATVTLATSEKQAIKAIEISSVRYQFILIDPLSFKHSMPALFNLLKQCKQKSLHLAFKETTKIIGIENPYHQMTDHISFYVLYDAIINKPFNPNMIKTTTQQLADATSAINNPEKLFHPGLSTLFKNRILIAEDNAINQAVLIGLLEETGMQIDIADNGKKAYQLAQDNVYNLILMDVHMPLMNGIEAATLIKKERSIPIIIISAETLENEHELTESNIIDGTLLKPVKPSKLYTLLFNFLEHDVVEPIINHRATDQSKTCNSLTDISVKYIDTQQGLRLMGSKQTLYLKVLKNFVEKYRGFTVEKTKQNLYELMHVLKGLSANIGANRLSDLATELQTAPNQLKQAELEQHLQQVVFEIEDRLLNSQCARDMQSTQRQTNDRISELFIELKASALKQSSLACNKILTELSNNQLAREDRVKVERAIGYINERNYQKIIDLL